MASINRFLGLNSGDKQWVDHISKTLKTQLAFTVDTPPVSIFVVPKTRKEEKPEAYAPQRTGLGPLYHFHHELYQKMERNKLLAAQSVLKPTQISDLEDQVIKKVKEIIPIISTCYDFYLDRDDDSLAWLFAIDGSGSAQNNPMQDLLEAINKLLEKIPGAEPILKIINSVPNKIPESMDDDIPTVEEIDVPSVSELNNIANVKFLLSSEDKGIKNIKFVPEELVCYLPALTLNHGSEEILRNLVAYENLMAKNSLLPKFRLDLTEYVDFMCGIIDTNEDVMLLRKENIIVSEMDDEEIVKLFNGIGRSLDKMSGKSNISICVAELNKVYENMPIVLAKRMAENQVQASAKAIKFLVSISSTLIVIREVYLKVYGSNPPPHMMLVDFFSNVLN